MYNIYQSFKNKTNSCEYIIIKVYNVYIRLYWCKNQGELFRINLHTLRIYYSNENVVQIQNKIFILKYFLFSLTQAGLIIENFISEQLTAGLKVGTYCIICPVKIILIVIQLTNTLLLSNNWSIYLRKKEQILWNDKK